MTGPNACTVCGPKLAGCWQCGSKLGHAHGIVYGRTGEAVGSVVVCRAHAPRAMGDVPPWAVRRAPRRVAKHSDPHKRWLDRTYRKAVSELKKRHADDLARLVDDARSF